MSLQVRRTRFSKAVKRTMDIIVASVVLIAAAPVLVVAAIGIRLTSVGPIFYLATRAGKGGRPFAMFKFRTMHVGSDIKSAITTQGDDRIFGFGLMLRNLKIDELPQCWNILKGDMSLVGPRPEDPKIVAQHYTDWMLETLEVEPGVTSPGAVYGYIYGDALLDGADPEASYARHLLPPKLALERAYLERAGFLSDLSYLLLTARAIIAHQLKKNVDIPLVDVTLAGRWAPQGPYHNTRT